MVAETVGRSTAGFRGLRPFNPTRDLGGVAILLEHAFREDLAFLQLWSRIPVLRNLSAYVWAASFAPSMPESLLGFVWEEENRIIGNVTVTPDESRRGHWLVSNVAVDDKYRRRGIARELMAAATDEARTRGATWLVLNVRPQNEAAITLYERLGFNKIDTEMGYVRRRSSPARSTPVSMRPLQASENKDALELARTAMGEQMTLFRPPRLNDFGIHFEDRLSERIVDFFVGQTSERWGYFEDGRLQATLLMRAQRIGTPHTLDIRIAPPLRGRLEDGILAFALGRLMRFPRRDISTRILTSHLELQESLAREEFVPTLGLMLMAKEL